MRKVIFNTKEEGISFKDVKTYRPIFAKNARGQLCGMLVLEIKEGWILKIGNAKGSDGHFETARECMKAGLAYGYTFYVED